MGRMVLRNRSCRSKEKTQVSDEVQVKLWAGIKTDRHTEEPWAGVRGLTK
jgi:hypothetical protein